MAKLSRSRSRTLFGMSSSAANRLNPFYMSANVPTPTCLKQPVSKCAKRLEIDVNTALFLVYLDQ